MRLPFLCFLLLLSLNSCIEILDDISFNADGSGKLNYTINLSSSKLKINSILALDSLDGQKVPDKEDIKDKIAAVITTLMNQDGISAVALTEDYENYVFKLSLSFRDINALMSGVEVALNSSNITSEESAIDSTWIS